MKRRAARPRSRARAIALLDPRRERRRAPPLGSSTPAHTTLALLERRERAEPRGPERERRRRRRRAASSASRTAPIAPRARPAEELQRHVIVRRRDPPDVDAGVPARAARSVSARRGERVRGRDRDPHADEQPLAGSALSPRRLTSHAAPRHRRAIERLVDQRERPPRASACGSDRARPASASLLRCVDARRRRSPRARATPCRPACPACRRRGRRCPLTATARSTPNRSRAPRAISTHRLLADRAVRVERRLRARRAGAPSRRSSRRSRRPGTPELTRHAR